MEDDGGAGLLLVVGSANADLVVRVPRHPAPGETVLGSDLVVHPGGKGANQAVAAARLGARVSLLACVGRDEYGKLLTTSLREAGVDTAALRTADTPTGVALITVGETSGENAIVVSPGANSRLTADDVNEALNNALDGVDDATASRVRVVCVQLEVPPATVLAAAWGAERLGARLLLNASPPDVLTQDRDLAGRLLRYADPLVVNEHEARSLLGRAGDPEELLGLGPRSAVLTLGSRGAVVVEPAGTTAIPGVPVEVVDTTGAGDAFAGSLGWRLAEGDDLVAAARWAVRVGAVAVREEGAQLSSTACGQLGMS